MNTSNGWELSYAHSLSWNAFIVSILVVGMLLGKTCEHDYQCSGTKGAICLHVQKGKVCSCQHTLVAINDTCFTGQYLKWIYTSEYYSTADCF